MGDANLPYRDLAAGLAALDGRRTDYRWDLERDLPWGSIHEPGDFLPADLVRDVGLDADALRAEPGAWELFQWASALLLCEAFVMCEREIIDFLEAQDGLLGHASTRLLHEEEHKHIAAFRRFADHLRDRHPEWTFDFDRLFVETGCQLAWTRLLEELERLDGRAAAHLQFWHAVVFFEEVTVYLHARLRRAPSVQPCWKALHEAHMREEVQHLLTDGAHVAACDASAVDWERARSVLASACVTDFDRTFGTRVARRMVAEAYPGLAFDPGVPAEATAVHADITARSAAFHRTRKLLAGAAVEIGGAAPPPARAADEIERWIVAAVAAALRVDPGRVDPTGELADLAVDSARAVELSAQLAAFVGRPVPPTLVWEHRSIRDIAAAYGAA
jgi:acyl carrier protein